MKNVVIRPATLADLTFLLEFEQGIIAAERPFDPTLKPDKINYYDLKALTLSDTAHVVVAELEGEIVAGGYAELRRAKDFLQHEMYAHLGAMFVKTHCRGKGINAQIITALLDWVKSTGTTEARLEVYAENVAALQAYKKVGFEPHILQMRLSVEG